MRNTSYNSLLLLIIAFNFSTSLVVEGCDPDDERSLFKIKSAFNNVSYFSTWMDQFAMQDNSENHVLSCQHPHDFQLEQNRGRNPSIHSRAHVPIDLNPQH